MKKFSYVSKKLLKDMGAGGGGDPTLPQRVTAIETEIGDSTYTGDSITDAISDAQSDITSINTSIGNVSYTGDSITDAISDAQSDISNIKTQYARIGTDTLTATTDQYGYISPTLSYSFSNILTVYRTNGGGYCEVYVNDGRIYVRSASNQPVANTNVTLAIKYII